MLLDIVQKGSTDRSVTIRIVDSTDGTPETSVEHNTTGIDLWYRREGAAVSSITEAALAALTTAHTDGGIEHISHGYYRLDIPDAAFATGANHVDIGGTVTGMVVIGGRVRLIDYDPEDSVRMGMTALPNAAADAAGGLPISDAGGLDLDGRLDADVSSRLATSAAPTNFGDLSITATTGRVDVGAVSGDATAADNLEADYDGTGYNKANSTIGTVTTNTDMRGTDGANTTTPLSAAGTRTALGMASANLDTQLAALPTTAEVNAEVDTALADYDAPTKAELDAGFAGLNDPTAAEIVNEWETQSQADPTGFHVNLMEINSLSAPAVRLALSAGQIVVGAAETGTLSTTQMTSDLTEATDDHYIGRTILWTSGALVNQATDITDYEGTNGLLTFTATTEAPSNGDAFIII